MKNCLCASVVLVLAAAAWAQPGHRSFVEHAQPVTSGGLSNPLLVPALAWTGQVALPNAGSLIVLFEHLELAGAEDRVILTSLLDGDVQILDQEGIKRWATRSAHFRGPVVNVALELGPGSRGEVRIFGALGQMSPEQPENLCGGDDRVASTDARTCRMVTPTGGGSISLCTGWLISSTSTILSAGHCAFANGGITSGTVAEFNVPASDSSGFIVPPPVADQFPFDHSSRLFEDTGIGNDWCVARLHPNTNGETAFDRQGSTFSLATSLPGFIPPFGPNVRLTGFGGDTQDTRNFTNQTSTGPLTIILGDTVSHQVDSEGGNSGGPLILVSSGEAIAIHTNGGCDIPVVGVNSGTSILNADLQTAIGTVSGCASVNLADGTSASITCTDTIFDLNPVDNRWNVVGVTSTTDWDLRIDGVSSVGLNGTCDFLLANDNLTGVSPPRSGRMNRFSGTANARAVFDVATDLSVGTPLSATWSSTSVLQAFEVSLSSASDYEIVVNGSTGLDWRLYPPGSSNVWRGRSSTTAASGAVGGGVVNFSPTTTGVHCLVIFKDDGAEAVAPTAITIALCLNSAPIVLAQPVEVAVTAACGEFSTPIVAGEWNAVAITSASTSNWDLYMGPVQSISGSGTTDFLLANGNFGAITPTTGLFQRVSGADAGTLVSVNSSNLTVGGQTDSTLVPGEIIRLFEFNAVTAGDYTIHVSGGANDTNLFWRLFEPGTNAQWVRRADTILSVAVGSNLPSSVTLGTGRHALLLYRNNGPVLTSTAISLSLCLGAPNLVLASQGNTQLVNPTCATFELTPEANEWNAVGLASDSNWDIAIGDAESETAGAVDFLVSNGRLGGAPPGAGTVVLETGTDPARLQHAITTPLTLGATLSISLATTTVLRIHEFEITTSGSYDLVSTGTGVNFALFEPGSSSAWRAQNSSVQTGPLGGTITRTYAAGWHAVVCHRLTGVGTAISYTVRIEPTPNPVPALTAISPATRTAGGAAFSLVATGTNYLPGSVIRWNGVNLTTTFVSGTLLSTVVSAALIATPGTASITVFTPTPGGGSSNALTLTIQQPVPNLTLVTPNTRIVGSPAFVLVLLGSNFTANSIVRWNGAIQPTNFIATSSLTASISAALLQSAGTALVTVFNPAPGGGTSSSVVFSLNNPTPIPTSTSPSVIVAGGASSSLLVNGSGFVNGSTVRLDGASLSTTFVNAGQLSAALTPAQLISPRVASVTVFVPAPGGGLSQGLLLPIVGPILTTLAPTVIPILLPSDPGFPILISGSNFGPQSVIHADGDPLATTLLNAFTLTATVTPAIEQTLKRGAVAIHVANSVQAVSRGIALEIGGGENEGLIRRHPLNPAPGATYAAVLEGAVPNALFSLFVDGENPGPLYPWIDGTMNQVLSTSPIAGSSGAFWIPIVDGFGLLGPPSGATLNADGGFVVPGFVRPNPAVGISITVQGIYLDATSPVGFRLTWARFPDRF